MTVEKFPVEGDDRLTCGGIAEADWGGEGNHRMGDSVFIAPEPYSGVLFVCIVQLLRNDSRVSAQAAQTDDGSTHDIATLRLSADQPLEVEQVVCEQRFTR